MHSQHTSLSVTETEQGRAFWLEQGRARQHLAKVTEADILIVPLKDFRERVPFIFHQNTDAFARFLASSLNGKATVEVMADDEEYVEITLHSAAFRFSPIIVGYVVAPLVVGLLTNYLYDVLKAEPGDSVEMSLVIEDQKCRSVKVDFKGDVKDFAMVADKVGQVSRECTAISTAPGTNSDRGGASGSSPKRAAPSHQEGNQ
jgi:hypothetical protein